MTRIIGLTGGIASGKSTVSDLLGQAGWPIVDADQVTRQVQRPGSLGLSRLVATFGSQILLPNGQLDRATLGQRVFGDDNARQQLNAIMQPLIWDAIWQKVACLKQAKVPDIILDVPLLFEQHYDQDCDLIIVVAVSQKVELHRLMQRNGYPKSVAQARIKAQLPLAKKVQQADFVIDNNGSLKATRRQVAQLVEDLRRTR